MTSAHAIGCRAERIVIFARAHRADIAIDDALDLYTKGKVAIEECKNKIDMIEKEVLKINPDGSTSSFDDADF